MSSFKELLRSSMKSEDTEERVDVYFTRPVGLAFALLWKRLGVHPNAITVLGMFLGTGAAYMFWHTDTWHNAMGVLLLMSANFCDSTDGQLARLTGKTSLTGRVLDGFSGDLWFFCIYIAICLRLYGQDMPGTDVHWGIWIFFLAFTAGALSHSRQSSLADYYRQIHLFFLNGDKGSELDDYNSLREIYNKLPRRQWMARVFYWNYSNYCKSQERRTPKFQALIQALRKEKTAHTMTPETLERLRDEFIAGSRPLLRHTNFLTFNSRAFCIYATCLAGCPYVYLILEVTLYNIVYICMRHQHESLCSNIQHKYMNT